MKRDRGQGMNIDPNGAPFLASKTRVGGITLSADVHAQRASSDPLKRLGLAKIDQPYDVSPLNQDVAGRRIAVEQIARVEAFECLKTALDEPDAVVNRHRPAIQNILEDRFPLDLLDDHERLDNGGLRRVGIAREGHEWNDVGRNVFRAEHLDLAAETGERVGLAGLNDHLDGQGPPPRGLANLEDDGGAPGADAPLEFIPGGLNGNDRAGPDSPAGEVVQPGAVVDVGQAFGGVGKRGTVLGGHRGPFFFSLLGDGNPRESDRERPSRLFLADLLTKDRDPFVVGLANVVLGDVQLLGDLDTCHSINVTMPQN